MTSLTDADLSSPCDAIVIGSGIGGLGCAAALARVGKRALVLERHHVPGGLTHTFSRAGYTWDVGVHYVGQAGPGQPIRRMLDWLSGGTVDFASMGAVYDILHLPDGRIFEFARPREAFERGLAEAFPHAAGEIRAFLAALDAAHEVADTPFRQHAMPHLLGGLVGWLHREGVARWWQRTLAEVLDETVRDPVLRRVLSAQWGDHGTPPSRAAFAMHALLMEHYLDGACYPVGGAASIARGLVPVIEQAGGAVRTGCGVARILVEGDAATGVELDDGRRVAAPVVVSDAGIRATLVELLDARWRDGDWGREALSLPLSVGHVALYLGLEGDVAAAGGTRANHWCYQGDDPEALWADPRVQPRPPAAFVSFPSLKDPLSPDPARAPGEQRHTAEVVSFCDWSLFEPFAHSRHGARPEGYEALRETLERSLSRLFAEHFPALAPMVRHRELSTPLSTAHFVSRERGAIYGLDTSPRRFASTALAIRTPVRGLLLAGQDPVSPGVAGALMGGVLAAAAITPAVFARMPR